MRHGGLGLALVVVALLLGGCSATDQAHASAVAEAREQLSTFRDSLVDFAPRTTVGTFADDVARGDRLYGVPVDLTDDESLAQVSVDGGLIYLFGGVADGDDGVVTGLVTGRGEAGGGGTFSAVQIAVCFEARIRPDTEDGPRFSDVECPPPIDGMVSGTVHVGVGSLL